MALYSEKVMDHFRNPRNVGCIKAAVQDYYEKNGIPYDKSLFPDCGSCGHCGDD